MADEDWSFLKDQSLANDLFDPLKYVLLPRAGWYLTLGGEARLSPQGFRIRSDDRQPSVIDNYFLQRYLLGADLHMGPRFRVFAELQSGLIQGRVNSPRPTDQDLLELHQAFFEYRSPQDRKQSFLLRFGRQELNIGSGRLIAPSQGLNVKRSFDGVLTNFTRGRFSVEAGAARLVRIRPGLFDDPPDSEQDFWGVNVTRAQTLSKTSQLSVYYLGIDRKTSVYAQGIGPETRHTVGSRFAGRRKRLDFNYDFVGQWGDFRGAPVRAWAVSTDTGAGLRLARLPARLGVSFNAASGDNNPTDPRLESFNPLFPGNSYSGLVGLFGPTNVIDLTPSFKVPLRQNLLVAFESPFYFRTSPRDGVYSIDLRLLLAGQRNLARRIGANPGVIFAWQANRHLSFNGAITRFQSGPFLADTFLRNGFGFYSVAGTFRF
jgi:hypothetical protein